MFEELTVENLRKCAVFNVFSQSRTKILAEDVEKPLEKGLHHAVEVLLSSYADASGMLYSPHLAIDQYHFAQMAVVFHDQILPNQTSDDIALAVANSNIMALCNLLEYITNAFQAVDEASFDASLICVPFQKDQTLETACASWVNTYMDSIYPDVDAETQAEARAILSYYTDGCPSYRAHVTPLDAFIERYYEPAVAALEPIETASVLSGSTCVA